MSQTLSDYCDWMVPSHRNVMGIAVFFAYDDPPVIAEGEIPGSNSHCGRVGKAESENEVATHLFRVLATLEYSLLV